MDKEGDTVALGLEGVTVGLTVPMAAGDCFLTPLWVRIQRKGEC